MSSSEEDYMSDAILAACGDTRPGLFTSAHDGYKRKLDMKSREAAEQNKTKPIKVRENEQRKEGLAKKLDENNKGFALLQKMGYTAGTALGKTGEGRIEPISVEVKSNRAGLGQEAEKRKNLEMRQMRFEQDHVKRLKAASAMQENFRNQKLAEQKYRVTYKYLHQSQRICLQLDTAQGLEEPENLQFWPEGALPQANDALDDEEESDSDPSFSEIVQNLTDVTAYLRTTHLYCLWCGHDFNDVEDLSNSCPGDTAEDHDEMS